jgi:predicted deacylase
MEPLIIYNQEILPGQTAELNLPVAELPTHTKVHLPVYVFRGMEPGPVLLVTAALHGDEVNGTETIRSMIVNKLLMPKAGTVIAMPIVNVYGFLSQSRALPDGKDLNRSFPGSKIGSLARRLAYLLLNEVVVHADYGIDLHTGGASRTNFPQVRCDFTRPESVELGKAFGAPYLLHTKEIPGSFRKSASVLGKSIIVFEGGESSRFDDYSISEARDGIQRLMAHLGMCDRLVAPRTSKILSESSWMRARIAGLFHPEVRYGDAVQKGEVIATLGDPYGEKTVKIKSSRTGFIIGLNNKPVVNAGDALIHIGVETG